MNILGVMVGTNSTAALLKDGRLVAAVSEERFRRKKNTGVYPAKAVEYCLKEASLNPEDIDIVVFDSIAFNYHNWVVDRDGTFTVRDWVREQKKYWKPTIYEKKEINYFNIFSDKIIEDHYTPEIISNYINPNNDIRPILVINHLGNGIKNIQSALHYECHHYYGYYMSPFREDRILSFVIEGWGDGTNATVANFERGVYKELYKTNICNIGRLYRYITLLLGMKPNEHEYKVMGLAAYNAHYDKVFDIFSKTLYVDGLEFRYNERPIDHYYWFKERLEGLRFDDIAAGLQKHIELLICEWIRNWIRKTGVNKIVISGGVAMNIKAMMEVSKLDEVHDMFVAGSGSDESTAVGACFRAHVNDCIHKEKDPNDIPLVRNLYLGPSYSIPDIKEVLNMYSGDHRFKEKEDFTIFDTARIISKGNAIARFSGRMEFGARALGNRSILADPRNLTMVRELNDQIKSRDFWMPFAPVIIEEREKDYLVNPKNISSPYMTIGFDTTELAIKDLICGLHQGDLTARPQILKRDENQDFYDLIKEFEKITGVGGLINTSFNLHGYPIVNTPNDAMYVFLNSDLKYLLMDNILVYDSKQKL